MKKRFLALLLAAVLPLSLTACGGNGNGAGSSDGASAEATTSKEELLEQAENITFTELLTALQENKLRAQETYVGNVYTYSECVTAIEEDYAELSGSVKVYLPKDDLMNLNVDERITVVGTIDSLDLTETSETINGFEFSSTAPAVEMKPAYYVDNRFEVTGPIEMRYMKLVELSGSVVDQTGLESAWLFEMSSDMGMVNLEEAIPVEHHVGQNITSLPIDGQEVANGDTITISCQLIDDSASLNRGTYESRARQHEYRAADVKLVRIDQKAAA